MNKKALIIGHRHPDTDSVAAAIAYAELKNKTEENGGFYAGICGKINRETEFVLSYFGVGTPETVSDVRLRVKDILDGGLLFIQPQATIRQAGTFMRQHNLKTLAVVDEEQHLLGLFTLGDLASLLLEAWESGRVPMEEPLVNFMRQNNLVVFDEDELLSEVQQTMLDTRYRNYPVADEEGHFLGLIGRYHLLGAKKKEVILVDHNEKNQTIAGIEEAKILEIIDHHRLADLETSEPIMVRNEPVGSTCAIISKIYREHSLKPKAPTAGILCAAILSDTLIFKSPTSTATDKKEAEWLAQIAAIELQNFGEEMFRAVSSLEGSSPREIILEDFKDFNFSGKKVGIGQIEVLSTDAIAVERVRLLKELEKIQQEGEYNLVALMVTDLTRQGTELLFTGPGAKIVERAFNVAKEAKSVFLPGVMSRKKEIIPPLRRFFEGA